MYGVWANLSSAGTSYRCLFVLNFNLTLKDYPASTKRSTFDYSGLSYKNLLPMFRERSRQVDIRGTLIQPNENILQRLSKGSHSIPIRLNMQPKTTLLTLGGDIH